jgi:DNA-binding MarR family transcriptional regulator
MPVELRALQSFRLWHDVHLGLAHQGGDLSSGQISILLTIDLEPPPHTVQGLARKLDVTKPVTPRLDALGTLDLAS